MKTKFLFLSAFLVLIATGCQKETDNVFEGKSFCH